LPENLLTAAFRALDDLLFRHPIIFGQRPDGLKRLLALFTKKLVDRHNVYPQEFKNAFSMPFFDVNQPQGLWIKVFAGMRKPGPINIQWCEKIPEETNLCCFLYIVWGMLFAFFRLKEDPAMPILKRLKELLDQARIPYEVVNHRAAFTAEGVAVSQHIPWQEMAKVVIVRADGSPIMAVGPANRMISLKRLKAALGAKKIDLTGESELAALFPECDLGGMPPFGNLFGLPVYVDTSLEKDETIFFNAGNHQQTVKMRYADFKKLVKPVVMPLSHERLKTAA
jgi:Ala-tRNA(Pro) deacylase